jgi:hypothetical protein
MFELLAADADNEYAMIDSTIVRARQHSAGAQKRWQRSSDRPKQKRIEHQGSTPWSMPWAIPSPSEQAIELARRQ